MPKRKSKLDEYEDDEVEPVTKKRSKAETKESKSVEKPEQKTDDQGLPYWEVQPSVRSHYLRGHSHVFATAIQQATLRHL